IFLYCWLCFLLLSPSCFFLFLFFFGTRPPPISALFPYTTLFRSSLRTALGRGFFVLLFWFCQLVGIVLFDLPVETASRTRRFRRSEEHTSELQSRSDLVCRLLLEKKKKKSSIHTYTHRTILSTPV